MSDLPVLHTARLMLRILGEDSAHLVSDYYLRNRHFHQPWFSSRSDEIFTARQQQKNLQTELKDFNNGRALPFWLSLRNEPKRIIGRFALTNMIHGSFRSCIASWHLDEKLIGQGYAREAGQAAMAAAYNDYKLHRIEANILPANFRSIKLAEMLGFELAGYENRYLEINGEWEDHLHYVKMADGPYYQGYELPELTDDHVLLRPLRQSDISTLVQYFSENNEHLIAYNPTLPTSLQTDSYWRRHLLRAQNDNERGITMNIGIFLKDRPDKLIGCLEIRDILKAPYNCCELGFSLDSRLTGQGFMLKSLSLILSWLFTYLNINRVHARYLPGNLRSEKVLEMLGFKREGLQRQAIITEKGSQDLVLTALLAEEFCWIE
ncbi:MAG: GNAT family N-acetyltransferase [Clostridiaceae bacterium]|nr:GNAT family N-acetyltransferase [Clostridiaceae bacterium]